MSKRLFQNLLLIFIGIGLTNCANRGTPSGGEKDTEPPQIIKSEPENFSTNFKGNEIRIYFNEYIKMKNLKIKINDTLSPNTTYAFNFGVSIVDNNEENPYPYYRYVFSTGSYIDSLSVS